MKIFKIAIICLSMMTLFSTMAFADTDANTAGAKFTIADTVGSGDGVIFTPSPTTLVSWDTLANSYAIITVSAKTNAANGKQFGVLSGYSPIYESRANVDANGTVTIDDPAGPADLGTPTVPITGATTWQDKAGNNPGS